MKQVTHCLGQSRRHNTTSPVATAEPIAGAHSTAAGSVEQFKSNSTPQVLANFNSENVLGTVRQGLLDYPQSIIVLKAPVTSAKSESLLNCGFI